MSAGLSTGHPCKICGSATAAAGSRRGILSPADFLLRRCTACGFGFVADPREDFEQIYDERYYCGQGADPLVDYTFELDHPGETIRRSEWEGIERMVRALRTVEAQTRWLDYGCGNGGLVRHLLASGVCDAVGFDTGWITERARAHGIPVLTEAQLGAHEGRCDVVTAIEVLEHVTDPLALLKRVRRLLKPGGLLFLTTANAARHPDLSRWNYVRPEIHVSFFEPRTLELAMQMSGFRTERPGFLPGYEEIIRFKVLKQLGFRRYRAVFDALPWRWMARLVDARMSVTAHPIGWAV